MNTAATSKLGIANEAQHIVLGQFDQVATLIREIAKIEALAHQEGISDGLKQILQQEAQLAYERLKTIRAWTDAEIGQLLSTATTPATPAARETTEEVDFASLARHEWELIDVQTRLRIQSGNAEASRIDDAKKKVRDFRRKLAALGKPYEELTLTERLRLRT